MTAPIQEPTPNREVAGLGFGGRQLFRRPPARPETAFIHVKVFSDTKTVTSGDEKFIYAISEDMDGMDLYVIEMYVTTVSSSGIVQVQIRNRTQAVDMLSTRVQVDASELNSKDSGTPAVINTANAEVAWADEICIDVDAAGTGAKGMGVIFGYR